MKPAKSVTVPDFWATPAVLERVCNKKQQVMWLRIGHTDNVLCINSEANLSWCFHFQDGINNIARWWLDQSHCRKHHSLPGVQNLAAYKPCGRIILNRDLGLILWGVLLEKIRLVNTISYTGLAGLLLQLNRLFTPEALASKNGTAAISAGESFKIFPIPNKLWPNWFHSLSKLVLREIGLHEPRFTQECAFTQLMDCVFECHRTLTTGDCRKANRRCTRCTRSQLSDEPSLVSSNDSVFLPGSWSVPESLSVKWWLGGLHERGIAALSQVHSVGLSLIPFSQESQQCLNYF